VECLVELRVLIGAARAVLFEDRAIAKAPRIPRERACPKGNLPAYALLEAWIAGDNRALRLRRHLEHAMRPLRDGFSPNDDRMDASYNLESAWKLSGIMSVSANATHETDGMIELN